MKALSLENVALQRDGRKILDDITVQFRAGRLTAVIGPNGAGKSTMLNIAAGLSNPDAGAVRLDDVQIKHIDRKELARKRAYLPQRAAVEWPIPVERVVALGLTPQLPTFGGLPDSLQPAIDHALAQCDVTHLKQRPATSLSGGELARVMLARAIVSDPELLIVDEPTAGLDPRHAIDAMRCLHARAKAGSCVVVAIHDLDIALNQADDLVAIRDGKILAAGPVETTATSSMFTALFDLPVRVVHDSEGMAIRFLPTVEVP